MLSRLEKNKMQLLLAELFMVKRCCVIKLMNPSKRVDNKELIANSGHAHKGLKGDALSTSGTRGKHNTVLLLIYQFTLKVGGSAFKFAQFRRASAFHLFRCFV